LGKIIASGIIAMREGSMAMEKQVKRVEIFGKDT
jgi:hypothetical protein